jgi:hypothetical protein
MPQIFRSLKSFARKEIGPLLGPRTSPQAEKPCSKKKDAWAGDKGSWSASGKITLASTSEGRELEPILLNQARQQAPNPIKRNFEDDRLVNKPEKGKDNRCHNHKEYNEDFGRWYEDDEAHCGKCGGYWWEDDARYKHCWGGLPRSEYLLKEKEERYKCNRCGHYRNRRTRVEVDEIGHRDPMVTGVNATGAIITKEMIQ